MVKERILNSQILKYEFPRKPTPIDPMEATIDKTFSKIFD